MLLIPNVVSMLLPLQANMTNVAFSCVCSGFIFVSVGAHQGFRCVATTEQLSVPIHCPAFYIIR